MQAERPQRMQRRLASLLSTGRKFGLTMPPPLVKQQTPWSRILVQSQWQEQTLGNLLYATRAAKGAPGPYHSSGNEAEFMVQAAIDVWYEIITKQWIPSQLKEARQFSLAKGKNQ